MVIYITGIFFRVIYIKRNGYSYILKKVSALTFGYMPLNPYILYLFKSFIVEETMETLFYYNSI